ncbi:MAG: VWA domain-containing protein [Spirochaetales bacterium]|nr:VWA domain-containing protein [Spirochaetales bacterium]
MNKVVVLFIIVILTIFILSCSDMLERYLAEADAVFDYVFVIDASGSMSAEIIEVKSALTSFLDVMNSMNVDARYAIVIHGWANPPFDFPHELVLDWTANEEEVKTAVNMISESGAVPDFQNNHSGGYDSSFEVIRMVLNSAVNNNLDRTYTGDSGSLVFRSNCKKKIILITDEDSDIPYYAENRFPGQITTDPPSPFPTDHENGWVQELNATADALITHNASLYIFMSKEYHGREISQYGDYALQIQNADYSGFDPAATLSNLAANELGGCLQARLLQAGRTARVTDIMQIDNPDVIENVLVRSLYD